MCARHNTWCINSTNKHVTFKKKKRERTEKQNNWTITECHSFVFHNITILKSVKCFSFYSFSSIQNIWHSTSSCVTCIHFHRGVDMRRCGRLIPNQNVRKLFAKIVEIVKRVPNIRCEYFKLFVRRHFSSSFGFFVCTYANEVNMLDCMS